MSRAAVEGDRVALEIQAQASADLAKMALGVACQLGFQDSVPCALGGGVLIHNPTIVQGLIEGALTEKFFLAPVEKVVEPARGAVRLALRAVRR